MRRLYAVVVAHWVASYAAVLAQEGWGWIGGGRPAGAGRQGGPDVTVLVAYPVLEPLVWLHYLFDLHRRFDWEVVVHLVTYPVVMLAAYAALRRLGRKTKHRPALCPCCGYDLRASPERCPECGTAVGP